MLSPLKAPYIKKPAKRVCFVTVVRECWANQQWGSGSCVPTCTPDIRVE